jgi:hypothetical protein
VDARHVPLNFKRELFDLQWSIVCAVKTIRTHANVESGPKHLSLLASLSLSHSRQVTYGPKLRLCPDLGPKRNRRSLFAREDEIILWTLVVGPNDHGPDQLILVRITTA